ncbi:hypothetical protein GCM10011613_10840 [Cellvibrio zantedeschiae]|uniref:Flagellar protein n=1 Tax=Cellvibrio zantedeschiae TaxID=1237077 RepID=A0ABQ3AUS3_9GAMM|nr:flagellar biosynthetic protein FliO [Cellvibrio zantedeschiae]GGY68450.1 hypothetical protein GCM10011613_10840 [Cellvibrio zantedeschiae]
MQNFTGSYKKSIAGILCALSISLISSSSIASDSTAPAANKPDTPAQVAASSATSETQPNPTATLTPTTNVKAAPVSAKTNSASQLASLVGGLALILVLIYGLSWFVKRFSQGGFLQSSTMKIVSAMPLGTRERLLLVDVGGKQLLLGITATQINTLHVFDEPVVQSEKEQPVSSDFSQKLMAILQQKNSASSSASSEGPSKKSNS